MIWFFFLANAASTNGDAPLIRIHRMWVIDVNVDAGCVLGVFALFSIKRLAFFKRVHRLWEAV